jgi:hypothetical protein
MMSVTREQFADCVEKCLFGKTGGWYVPARMEAEMVQLNLDRLWVTAKAYVDYLRDKRHAQRLQWLYGKLTQQEREVFNINMRQILLWCEITARKEVQHEPKI